MKASLLHISLILAAVIGCCLTLPRQRPQDPEFNLYPFKEICAATRGLRPDEVADAFPNGTTDSQKCHEYTLVCDDVYGNRTVLYEECGIGMWWSFVKGTCEIPSLANRADCVTHMCGGSTFIGGVPDPRACYGFYECEAGNAFFEMCENNSYYNPTWQSCEDARGVGGCNRPAPIPQERRHPSCAVFDLPTVVCLTPGYIPSSAYCGCVHQHLERR